MKTLQAKLEALIKQTTKFAESVIAIGSPPLSNRDDFIGVYSREIFDAFRTAGWKSEQEFAEMLKTILNESYQGHQAECLHCAEINEGIDMFLTKGGKR